MSIMKNFNEARPYPWIARLTSSMSKGVRGVRGVRGGKG